jgi:hypothetical protein
MNADVDYVTFWLLIALAAGLFAISLVGVR